MSGLSQATNPKPPLGGRYQITKQLGSGGFSQTFLALDLHLPGHPPCVVKQLKSQTSDIDSLQMARRFFEIESQALYRLGVHDQIPRLFAHFEENNEFYLVQELIEGKTLNKELLKGKPWPEPQVVALLRDILQVLVFVHQEQVIHRDIKPSNLIHRYKDSKLVLIDFGAVKEVTTQFTDPDAGVTNLTISVGTQGYMPNEQLAGKPRFSSDIYAVGVMGIQALTGVRPKRFREDPQTGEIVWRGQVPSVSPELADVLDRMVRYDFRDRYPTADDALEALENLPAPLLAESLPVPQLGAEEADDWKTGETSTEQSPQPGTLEPLEPKLDLSTSIWVQSNSSVDVHSATNDTPSTVALSEFVNATDQSQHSEAVNSIANTPLPRTSKRWLGLGLAVLAIAGITFAITKTVLFPRTGHQLNVDSSPVETPTPTPLSPEQRATELFKQAENLRNEGEYQEAIAAYNKVIDIKPKMAQAYWGLCYSLNGLKQPEQAIVACNDALALKPNYPEALISKANALDQQKQDIQALRLYEKATRINPKFAQGWLNLGIALQNVGRSVEAIRALDRAIALERNLADAWSTKGEALWNLGRFDQAIPVLDKALQLEPNHPQAQKLRQQIREKLGR